MRDEGLWMRDLRFEIRHGIMCFALRRGDVEFAAGGLAMIINAGRRESQREKKRQPSRAN
jgi:hypothetical protein